MNDLLAVRGKDCIQSVSGQAPFNDPIAFLDFGSFLNVFIGALIIFAGLFAFIQLALGGFQYVSSGGDKIHVEDARKKITYAILGLGIVVAAVAVNQVLGAVFGVNLFGNIKWPGADTIVGNLGICN